MSKQLTLGEDFEKYAKTTKRAQFLSDMDRIVPWTELCELIAPVYPIAEDVLYDSVSMRRFIGPDLDQQAAPDDTTVCRFRLLLEKNPLGEALFQYVLEHPFLVIKRSFGFVKTRYKGLDKNAYRLFVTSAGESVHGSTAAAANVVGEAGASHRSGAENGTTGGAIGVEQVRFQVFSPSLADLAIHIDT